MEDGNVDEEILDLEGDRRGNGCSHLGLARSFRCFLQIPTQLFFELELNEHLFVLFISVHRAHLFFQYLQTLAVYLKTFHIKSKQPQYSLCQLRGKVFKITTRIANPKSIHWLNLIYLSISNYMKVVPHMKHPLSKFRTVNMINLQFVILEKKSDSHSRRRAHTKAAVSK